MIDRSLLRYFLAVVDAGNFSRAARQVNVSQPALSVGIAKLEAELEAKVFSRNSQRVELTEVGVRLLTHARAIEREFNGLESRIREPGPTRRLRVGILSTVPMRLVLQAIVGRRHPHEVRIELVEGAARDLIGRLQRRRIDVALTVITSGETRFVAEPLFEEGYSMATAEDHPRAGAGLVPGEAFAQDTMIVRRHCEVLAQTSRYFTERGVRPHFSFRSTNDERVIALVKAGLGVTVVPDSYAEQGLALVKLAGFDHRRAVGLLFASPESAAECRGYPTVEALNALGAKGRSGR